jgi:heme exporter protein CcmD
MTYAGYVAAGYGITTAAIGVYVWRVLARGRALARSLPPEERRWR